MPRSVCPALSLGPPVSAWVQVRRQISAVSTLRVRSPYCAQSSSLREPGAQDPAGPLASQDPLDGGWFLWTATQGL